MMTHGEAESTKLREDPLIAEAKKLFGEDLVEIKIKLQFV